MRISTRVGVAVATTALGASVALAGAGVASASPFMPVQLTPSNVPVRFDNPSSATITKADATTVTGTFTNKSGSDVMCVGYVSEAKLIADLAAYIKANPTAFGAGTAAPAYLENEAKAATAAGHFGMVDTSTYGILAVQAGKTIDWKATLDAPTNGATRTDFNAGTFFVCMGGDQTTGTITTAFAETAYENSGILGSVDFGGSLGDLTGSLGS